MPCLYVNLWYKNKSTQINDGRNFQFFFFKDQGQVHQFCLLESFGSDNLFNKFKIEIEFRVKLTHVLLKMLLD